MPPPRPQQAAEADTAKTIPTVPVQAPALALTAPDRTAGFAAMTESWRGNGAFAPAPEREEANLPPEVTIAARFDEINAIDLAADAASDPAQQSSTSENMAGVALVTPASAAPPSRPDTATPADATAPSSAGTAPKPEETSWLSWLYGQVVDGVRTVVLAIRSIFS